MTEASNLTAHLLDSSTQLYTFLVDKDFVKIAIVEDGYVRAISANGTSVYMHPNFREAAWHIVTHHNLTVLHKQIQDLQKALG